MVFGLLSSVFGQVLAKSSHRAAARGWGERYRWESLEDGYREAARRSRPMMVVVHKMTCPTCHSFKKRFAKSELVNSLSDSFVLVNLDISEVPVENNLFAPDGHYFPRVLFLTPKGYLMSDMKNPYRDDQQFTYSDPAFLAEAMQKVLDSKIGKASH